MNDPDCIGQTPLFYAVTHCQVDLCLCNHPSAIKVLLKAARPSGQDRGARIYFKGAHFGVFSTSRFVPSALSSDWT